MWMEGHFDTDSSATASNFVIIICSLRDLFGEILPDWRGSAAEYQRYSGELGYETQGLFRALQFSIIVCRIGESERTGIGKGCKTQPARIQCASKIFWTVRILANHRVGNLNALVAGSSDCSKNVID